MTEAGPQCSLGGVLLQPGVSESGWTRWAGPRVGGVMVRSKCRRGLNGKHEISVGSVGNRVGVAGGPITSYYQLCLGFYE